MTFKSRLKSSFGEKAEKSFLSHAERKVTCMHDYTRYMVCLKMLETNKATSMFPLFPLPQVLFSLLTTEATRTVLKNHTETELHNFLTTRVSISNTSSFLPSYINRANSQVTHSIKPKFAAAIYSSLPNGNPQCLCFDNLYSSSCFLITIKQGQQ